MFEVRVNDRDLKRLERQLAGIPRAMPRVMSAGLNRTATGARTKIARTLAGETGIKVGSVRQRLSLIKATHARWRSGVRVSSKRLSLSVLQPRETRRGLTVKHGRKRVLIRRAFSARKQWFIRQPISGTQKGILGVGEALAIGDQKLVARLPVGAIKGPILARVFAGAESEAARIHAESMNLLAKNIHDQVRRILAQRRAG
jgi:hypothetical protein